MKRGEMQKKFFRFSDRLPYFPFYRTIVLNVKVKTKKLEKSLKKARIFLGHSAQDCSKRTLVCMGILFIEAVKKSPGIKILSLVITKMTKNVNDQRKNE